MTDILDCHQHVLIKELFEADDNGTLEQWISTDLDGRRSMMKAHDIASAVLLPSFDYDKSQGIKSTRRALDLLMEYQSRDTPSFPWLGCNVEPQHYSAACSLLEELLSSGSFAVVTWHNRFHGVPADAPVMVDLSNLATEASTPVFLHAAGNLDHEEAWRIARLVRRCPAARFVILDGLMTLASYEVLTDLAKEAGNVWLDIANALPIRRVVENVGQEIGWDRVLFGSCFYSTKHSFTKCAPLGEFLASDPGQETSMRVLRSNLLGLLGPLASSSQEKALER